MSLKLIIFKNVLKQVIIHLIFQLIGHIFNRIWVNLWEYIFTKYWDLNNWLKSKEIRKSRWEQLRMHMLIYVYHTFLKSWQHCRVIDYFKDKKQIMLLLVQELWMTSLQTWSKMIITSWYYSMSAIYSCPSLWPSDYTLSPNTFVAFLILPLFSINSPDSCLPLGFCSCCSLCLETLIPEFLTVVLT